MKEYYYLNTRHEPQGPYSLDQLAAMMAGGRVNPTTLIAAKGDSSWEPLGSVLSRENIATPEVSYEGGQVGNCPGCGHELSVDVKDGQLPAVCPACARNLWSGLPGIPFRANFRLAFKNYAKFTGRATRAEYWCFQLINGLIILGAYIVILALAFVSSITQIAVHESNTDIHPDEVAMTGGEVAAAFAMLALMIGLVIWMLYTFIPNISLTVRRMHDVGWSGKWLIPYALISFLTHGFLTASELTENAELAVPLAHLAAFCMLACYACGIFLFVLTLFDSKRGPNKYGPSSKYPLG